MSDEAKAGLRECPFCGSKNVGVDLSGGCAGCCVDCGAEGPFMNSEKEAITAWNTRQATTRACLPAGSKKHLICDQLAEAATELLDYITHQPVVDLVHHVFTDSDAECSEQCSQAFTDHITRLRDALADTSRQGPLLPQPDERNSNTIINALRALGITADGLFESIRDDLERGLVNEARARLEFVDKLQAEVPASTSELVEALKAAADDFVSFNLPSEGMPHIGSEAWKESRERLKAALAGVEGGGG